MCNDKKQSNAKWSTIFSNEWTSQIQQDLETFILTCHTKYLPSKQILTNTRVSYVKQWLFKILGNNNKTNVSEHMFIDVWHQVFSSK